MPGGFRKQEKNVPIKGILCRRMVEEELKMWHQIERDERKPQ
jgi:hypothetical protein